MKSSGMDAVDWKVKVNATGKTRYGTVAEKQT